MKRSIFLTEEIRRASARYVDSRWNKSASFSHSARLARPIGRLIEGLSEEDV